MAETHYPVRVELDVFLPETATPREVAQEALSVIARWVDEGYQPMFDITKDNHEYAVDLEIPESGTPEEYERDMT